MPENTRTTGRDPLYEVVDVLRTADGMAVAITRKRSSGQLSLSLFKEYDRDGQVERSAYFARGKIDNAIQLLTDAGKRMDELEDQARAQQRAQTDERTLARRRANGRR